MANLTRSQRAILLFLDGAPDKRMERTPLRKLAGLSIRGFSIVANRMVDARFIAPTNGGYQLTVGGMRALGGAK